MKKFQEIEQFRNALRNVQHKAQFVKMGDDGEPIMNRLAIMPKLKYESTVKIHGCCSSVRLEGNVTCSKITAQSRNNEITPEKDNYGFATFIHNLPMDVWTIFKDLFGDNIIIHGEWAGKGIQDTVAVTQVEKFWAIFRIEKISEDEHREWIDFRNVKFPYGLEIHRIYSIYQFGVEELTIDFEHPAEYINKMNELTLAVEKECPVGKFFGISGIGEGRVWSCVEDGWKSSKYVFKVKGNLHSKSKVTKLANVNVEKMKSIDDFVNMAVDEGRCQQAFDYINTLGKPIDEKLTGDFLRWLVNDINKEESDTINENGLTPKDVNGAISKAGRQWFFRKIGNV